MIRLYEPADLEELLNAWEAATRLAHPFLSDAFLAQERENIPNVYLPNAETWVDERDGKVVGFIALIGDEVGAIFVHPAQQRQGIGWRLMDKARERRGVLEVEVFAANSIGRGFYARYGFTPIEEKTHEPTGQALLRLRLGEA